MSTIGTHSTNVRLVLFDIRHRRGVYIIMLYFVDKIYWTMGKPVSSSAHEQSCRLENMGFVTSLEYVLGLLYRITTVYHDSKPKFKCYITVKVLYSLRNTLGCNPPSSQVN
jgi:hypothetical protein